MTTRSLAYLFGSLVCAVVVQAYPPAPSHVLYGTVRDELGRALANGVGTVIISNTAGEIVRAPTEVAGEPGVNYLVRIPMDLGSLGSTYQASALLPASPFTIRVVINNVSYVPLQVSKVPPTIGQPGGRTRLDLSLGIDSDGDGLPDAWERNLIDRDTTGRLRTLADVKPGDDLDGDGLTNLQEYLLGTYALDRLDGIALDIVKVESGMARLRFSTVPGRTYSVRSSTDLNAWAEQPIKVDPTSTATQTTFVGRDITVVEVWAPLPPGGTAFYRLYAQ
jgi:hypothetical protein